MIVGDDPSGQLSAMAAHGDTLVASSRASVFELDRFVGSTTEAILGESGDPVVVVGPACDVDKPFDVDAVVVTLPGLDGDTATAAIGSEWAALHDVPMWLVSVVDEADAGEEHTARRRHLQHVGHALRTSHIDVDWDAVAGHDVAATVIERWGDRSLIVAATHPRFGLDRVAHRSPAMSMCSDAKRAVILVPTPDSEA